MKIILQHTLTNRNNYNLDIILCHLYNDLIKKYEK